jgi:hypothetical protein
MDTGAFDFANYKPTQTQLLLGSHFLVNYLNEGRAAIATDHFVHLIPGLLGVEPVEASALCAWLGIRGAPAGGEIHDPLLDYLWRTYGSIHRTDDRPLQGLLVRKTMAFQGLRAFCQSTGDRSAMVEIWAGASAALAAVSIVLAESNHYTHVQRKGDLSATELETHRLRYVRKVWEIVRLSLLWQHSEQVTFDRADMLLTNALTASMAVVYFRSALSFLLYHELAHHFLGHVAANLRAAPTKQMRHEQEFAADADAFQTLQAIEAPNLPIGPLVVFIASSLLSAGSDAEYSPTHPPMVDRFQRLASMMLDNDDDGNANSFLQGFAAIVMRTLFLRMPDRDRIVDWFGDTSKRWENFQKSRGCDDWPSPAFFNVTSTQDVIAPMFDRSGPKAAGRKLAFNLF